VWNSYGVGVQVVTGDVVHTSVIYLIDRKGYERVAFPTRPKPPGSRVMCGSSRQPKPD